MSNMQDLINKMTDIENSSKEQLNEAASLTVNAETGAEIADMISAMQGNAGMGKPVPADMPMPMRHDIDKFRAAMDDDPNIPGKDDVPGDQDLQAGLLGALGGAATGSMIPGAGAALGGAGAVGGGALGGMIGGPGGAALGSKIGGAIGRAAPAAIGGMVGDKLTGEEDVDEITKAQEKLPPKLQKAIKDKEEKEGKTDEWANSAPGEEEEDRGTMGDYEDNIRDGSDLHRKKDRRAIRTVNPALENIKDTLYKALAEKKAKPDYIDIDGDGDKKEPMKKAVKDKKAKKVSEGEFKKTGAKGDGSAKFDEMGCKNEMQKLNASGCAKKEMYDKVAEKYGCSKGQFEKLYAAHCA